MSKLAEQKALEAYPEHRVTRYGPLYAYDGTDTPSEYDENIVTRKAFIEGYDQAFKDFMEKACEWLKDNSKKYVVCYEDGYSHYAYNSMIDDFKNYMQNE